MKKLFALQGMPESGKTITLKSLIKELSRRYPSAVKECYCRYYEVKQKAIEFEEYMRLGKDKVVSFDLPSGKRVAVITYGEPQEALRMYLKAMIERGHDIIFCACRMDDSQGAEQNLTTDWVNESSKDGYQYTFINQEKKKRRKECVMSYNNSQVQALLKEAGL